MTTRAKLTVYSALATALASLCLLPLLTTRSWLTHAVLVITVLAGVGAGLRRSPLYRWTVPIGQLLVLLLLLLLGFAGAGGVLPGPATMRVLDHVFTSGLNDIQQYAIPAPPTPGLRLILVSAVGLIAVAVDTVAVTYRRSALAGLPLLALYSVGNGLAGDHGSWFWFALAAAGYLLLLFAEGQDRVSRWGRVFRGTPRGTVSSSQVRPGGQQVGVLALAVAMVLPVVLPHWGFGLLHSASGGPAGKGSGRGVATSLDPLVSLEAAITKPTDAELLTYTLDSTLADQIYLRTGSLDQFDGTNWRLGSTTVNDLPDPLPAPEGLRNPNVPRIEGDFQVSDRLENSWLPLPYPAASVQVPNRGDWKLDPVTRTVVPSNEKAIRGLRYHANALDLRPTANELRLAPSAPQAVRDRYTVVPSDLPPVVSERARAVTSGAQNDYDRAMALVKWFTGPDFTYDTTVSAGTGSNAIAVFLQDRRGFCVHFASTMAAMARVLKIPARVAVGFTPGDNKGGNVYSVTGRMYHAWPELYFTGYGWLRFEPTPSRGIPTRYTETASAPTTAPTQQATAAPQTASAAPAPSAGSDCAAKQRQLGDCGPKGKTAAKAAEESWLLSGQVLGTLAAVLAVIALLLTPMLWRTAVRRRRLGRGGRRRPGGDGPLEPTDAQVLAAWDELIDSAWDLGIPPDESRTPRSAARRITEKADLDADSAAAAGRLALATERVLYAPPGQSGPAPLTADVHTARRGLRASVSRAGRTRALLLPPSSAQLWWGIADTVRAARAAVGTGVGRAVEAVSAPVRRVFTRRPEPDAPES
ncbi:transglutaminaseTgpA domain-containing protein [Streptomyces sp. NRRL S-350]|uniref:transglutaminase family protein n=1 Tax=Streptomyces sp. NRRL S-350 TaxID=1463902 RepID=UPI0004C26604|nr:transglutaminaseTgpA domain-containing protein [Streptomyces sp. NRRL S-350]